MNEKSHWNKIAASYDDEIFDVFKSDRKKVLRTYFRKYANKKHRAIDFGCGTGKAFPYLAPAFRELIAVDISDACLVQARKNKYTNIRYQQADLSKRNVKLQTADFIFCCNVIMLPEPEKNVSMIWNVYRTLRRGGAAVIVVPAMESYLFAAWRLIEWYKKEGTPPSKIASDELSGFQGSKIDILQGILQINGVRTKHYLQPELEVLFTSAGLRIGKIDRVEYDWNSEFSSPPKWMKEPFPWDWLVEVRK